MPLTFSLGLNEPSSALLWLLDENTRIIMQSFLPMLAGFGIGMLFHAPYQALTSVLSPKELAAGTGAFFLVRFTGATVGLARIFVTTVLLLQVDIYLCLVHRGCDLPKQYIPSCSAWHVLGAPLGLDQFRPGSHLHKRKRVSGRS
jgi:hypothetical protein